MAGHYVLGVTFGILGGILTQGGQLLEKKAVNDVRNTGRGGYLRNLLRSPTWLVGFIVGIGGGTVAYVLAQSLIGPALVPGLMAFGLIVLAIGSVRMNHEELNASEVTGIVLMILGVFMLGLSGLQITRSEVNTTLSNHTALLRIGIFSLTFFSFFIFVRRLIRQIKHRQGVLIALGNGFLSCLTDFWVNPFIAILFFVLKGTQTGLQLGIFLLAGLILLSSASFITWQNQIAFKVAQASNVVPVAQVPIQISPVVVYFFVFALTAPNTASIFYILSGTVLTIVAGFLLSRRQEVPIL